MAAEFVKRQKLLLLFSLKVLFCNPIDCSLPSSPDHGISQAKNPGVGYHFLLQGIFPIQGWNPGLLWLLYQQANSLHCATWEVPFVRKIRKISQMLQLCHQEKCLPLSFFLHRRVSRWRKTDEQMKRRSTISGTLHTHLFNSQRSKNRNSYPSLTDGKLTGTEVMFSTRPHSCY